MKLHEETTGDTVSETATTETTTVEATAPAATPAKPKKARAPKADGLGTITADAAKRAKSATVKGKAPAKAKAPAKGKGKAAAAKKPAVKAKAPAKAKAAPKAVASADKKPNRTDQVVGLLKRKGGASVPQIMEETGWLPHTTRAFLSAGLLKKGIKVTSEKEDGVRVYRLAAA